MIEGDVVLEDCMVPNVEEERVTSTRPHLKIHAMCYQKRQDKDFQEEL